jgi:hypothetical protein
MLKAPCAKMLQEGLADVHEHQPPRARPAARKVAQQPRQDLRALVRPLHGPQAGHGRARGRCPHWRHPQRHAARHHLPEQVVGLVARQDLMTRTTEVGKSLSAWLRADVVQDNKGSFVGRWEQISQLRDERGT